MIKEDWSTLRKLLFLKATGGKLSELTETGNPVSFTTDVTKAMKITAPFSPVQSGSGDPYPPGGGKNKFKNYGVTETISGVTFTVRDDGTINVNGTATDNIIYTISKIDESSPLQNYSRLTDIGIKANESYILNGCSSGGGESVFRLQLLVYGSGKEPFDYGSGSSAFTFTAEDVADKWYRLAIRILSGVSMNNAVFKPMIRLSSVTDGTFAPYSNIRPISGFTGVNVNRTGKNLLKIPQGSGTMGSDNGISITTSEGNIEITGSSVSYGTYDIDLPIVIPKGTVVKLSGTVSGSNISYRLRNKTSGDYTGIAFNDEKALSFDVDRFQVASNPNIQYSYTASDIQLEYIADASSPATTYTPYSGNTYSVTFPALGKNLFDGQMEYGNINDTGTPVPPSNQNYYRTKDFAVVSPSTQYTISGMSLSDYSQFYTLEYDEEGDFISGTRTKRTPENAISFTTGIGTHLLKFFFYKSNGVTEGMASAVILNAGNTALPYEPYTNTAYAGELEVDTGVLTVTHKSITIDGTTNKIDGIYANGCAYTNTIADIYNDVSASRQYEILVKCDKLKATSSYNISSIQYGISQNTGARLIINHPNITTTANWNTWLSSNNLQVIIELATPITYQLTPVEIKSLIGTNVVWNELNEDMTVKYKKKG